MYCILKGEGIISLLFWVSKDCVSSGLGWNVEDTVFQGLILTSVVTGRDLEKLLVNPTAQLKQKEQSSKV